MRLLHVVPSYLPATRYGGPIYSVHGLCKSLANRGHEVHVYTTNIDGPGNTDVPLETPVEFEGVKVWFFPSNSLRRLYWSPSMLRRMRLAVPTFNIIHLHSIFLWPTWAAARIARHSNVPYVLTPRGMLVKELIWKKSRLAKSLWIRFIEKKNLEKAAVIHCTSKIEMKSCQEFGFNLPHFKVIPNGIDDESNVVSTNEPRSDIHQVLKKQPLILYLGRVNWKKGLDRLIPALTYVPMAHLVIAGHDDDGYSRDVFAMAEKAGVADRITQLGSVNQFDKAVLYKNAKVFVLTSYSENFGNSVLEALAHECPVVVTAEVGVSDAINGAGSGIVTEGRPEAIAEGINRILADDRSRTLMGRAGRRLIRENYCWDGIAHQMEAEYQLHI